MAPDEKPFSILCNFVCRFDPEEEIKTLANNLWEEAGLEIDDRLCTSLVDDIIHPVSSMKRMTIYVILFSIQYITGSLLPLSLSNTVLKHVICRC